MSDHERRARSDDEGEPTAAHGVDMEDSEEEPDDIEETEEDRRFIADNEDENDNEQAVLRKKKRRRRRDAEELDEEDFQLVEENTGLKLNDSKTFKRLKRRKDNEDENRPAMRKDRELSNIFDDDMDDLNGQELQEEVDDFIVSDVEPEEEAYHRAHKQERRSRGELYGIGNGLAEEAYDQMYEIFGDGTEYDWALELKKENVGLLEQDVQDVYEDAVRRTTTVKLADMFEPSEIQEKLLTEEDEEIRITDVPERMQLNGVQRIESNEELVQAARWCAAALQRRRNVLYNPEGPDPLYEAIIAILTYLRKELLELPFIIRHRKDYWQSIFSVDELWALQEDDDKFQVYWEKSKKLLSRFERLAINNPDFHTFFFAMGNVDEVADVNEYLSFTHAQEFLDMMRQDSTVAEYKRAIKIETYEEFRQPHIDDFIHDFVIPPEAFSHNLRIGMRSAEPRDPIQTPIDKVALIAPRHVSAEKFLGALITYLAQTLCHHPDIRRYYRRRYELACISVTPTEVGARDIDENHPFYVFKHITRKPVDAFKRSDQFLQMLRAEEDGLIILSIELPDKPEFLRMVIGLYSSHDALSEWNTTREQIVREADSMLSALMNKHVRERLRTEATEYISLMCEARLFKMARVAPYVPKDARERLLISARRSRRSGAGDEEDKAACKILGLAQFNEGRAVFVFGAVIDENGLLIDQFIDKGTLDEVELSIEQHKPSAVVISGYQNVSIRRTLDELTNRLKGRTDIELVVLDDEVARLYQHSTITHREHPDLNVRFRYALSIARRLQNPVMEIAALFNQQKDAVMLNLHPHQAYVPQDTLFRRLERAMITVVSGVGVDINGACEHPHHAHTLQFVAGLGPRKASGLLQKLVRDGILEARSHLVTRDLMAKVIFLNCASFIRIRVKYLEYRRDRIDHDPLDDTRIHPEDYSLARKMAKDALDIDDIDDTPRYVEEVMDNYGKDLEDLELDDYAKVIADKMGKKRLALEDIKLEMQFPYQDLRPPFEPPDADLLFKLLTGETDETLRVNLVVPALVTQVRDKFCRVRLECGIEGIIFQRNMTDKNDAAPADVVHQDQAVKALVMSINKEAFQVELSIRPMDIEQPIEPLRRRDDFFDTAKEEIERKHTEAKRRKRTVIPGRMIKHPQFRPFNSYQAANYLKSHRNEIVIRPSSTDPEKLIVSWIVTEDIIQSIEVQQDPETAKYLVQRWSETYFDLDEILHRYVERCQMYTEKLLSHRKYFRGSRQDLSHKLYDDLMINETQYAYGVCVDDKHPGYFLVMYKKNRQHGVVDVPIKVTPKGVELQRAPYQDVDVLLNAFKNMASGRR